MKSITILTGPQGSGNHLFSKIFCLSDRVSGWTDNLISKTWVGHDQEPYHTIWDDVSNIDNINWDGQYHVISISCPYVDNRVLKTPKYKEVKEALKAKGFNVQFAIIGRDQNILEHQQKRLREKVTYFTFMEQLEYLKFQNHHFLSQELVYLYGDIYIRSVGAMLNIPVITGDRLQAILINDANKKYINPAEDTEQDEEVRTASKMNKPLDEGDTGC